MVDLVMFGVVSIVIASAVINRDSLLIEVTDMLGLAMRRLETTRVNNGLVGGSRAWRRPGAMAVTEDIRPSGRWWR